MTIGVIYMYSEKEEGIYILWLKIERDGNKDIEIAESLLSAKDNAILVAAIDRHWEFLNEQITRAFNGEKTKVKNLEK